MHKLLIPVLLSFLTACGAESPHASTVNSTTGSLKVTTSLDSSARVMRAVISTKDNDLKTQTNITKYIGRAVASLTGDVAAENLLTDFSKSRAFTKPRQEVTNCWYTAIASLMPSFTEERYMGDAEFSCVMNKGFKKTTTPQFGDVIRFKDAKGGEVHGATYIGVDQDGKIIAFTKNGPTKETPWTFMSVDSLRSVYRDGSDISYFTPVKEFMDPKSAGDNCFEEAERSRQDSREMSGAPGRGPLADWDM